MNDLELAEEIERRRDSEAREYAQLALSYGQWQQIIAALRRAPERPPSGEMVTVPREPTRRMQDIGRAQHRRIAGAETVNQADCAIIYCAMIAAAEASKEAK